MLPCNHSSYDSAGVSFSPQITTMSSLMLIGLCEIKNEMFLFCHMTSHEHMIKGTFDLVTERDSL